MSFFASPYSGYSAYDPYAQQAAYRRALAEKRAHEQQRAQALRARQAQQQEELAYRRAVAAQRQQQRQREEAAYHQALRRRALEREMAQRRAYNHPSSSFFNPYTAAPSPPSPVVAPSPARSPSPGASSSESAAAPSDDETWAGISDTEEGEEAAETDSKESTVESPATPTPSTMDPNEAATVLQRHYRTHLHRKRALAAIASLSSALEQHRSSYVPPAQLEFQPTAGSEPKLAFSSINAPHLAAEDFLVGLLTKCDAVETGGDRDVKRTRKALVVAIEEELAKLDAKKVADFAKATGESEAEAADDDDEDFYDAIPDLLEPPLPSSEPSKEDDATSTSSDDTVIEALL